MEKVTVEGLDKICEEISDLEEQKDRIEDSLTSINKNLNTLIYRAAAYLKDLGRSEYHAPAGSIKVELGERINLPVTEQDKAALFAHLRERGIFDSIVKPNSQSLNALYMADRRAAVAAAPDDEKMMVKMTFAMPGIGEVKCEEKPKFKRAKKGS